MSTAHRPTWNPTEGRADVRHMTRRVAAQELPAHTKLKFRQPQQGGGPSTAGSNSTGRSDQYRRDLKRELEAAERANRNKKRREQGLAPEEEPREEEDKSSVRQAIEGAPADGRGGGEQGDIDDEELQRRRMVAQLQELDRDESDSDSDAGAKTSKAKGKGKANGDADDADDDDSSDSSSDSSNDDDDEDETAALMRELEKIKRERAEEKERQERERAEMQQASREEEIALGNPLLNLENALKRNGQGGASRGGRGGDVGGGFGVKRRWDDDVIFKNQAAGNDGTDKSGFINDLTRSEFHKRFMQRYVK